MDEYLDWLAFIYNTRGDRMVPEVWEKFKAFVEARAAIMSRDPPFERLRGGPGGCTMWGNKMHRFDESGHCKCGAAL
jgi:hypothetical protein